MTGFYQSAMKFSHHLRLGCLLVLVLTAGWAQGQFAVPPSWAAMTETQRYLSSLYMPGDTSPWSDATVAAYVGSWGQRGSFQACGMLQRNQGSDVANALKVLQRLDAAYATGTDATMDEFGGMGLVAARGYFANLFDAVSASAVDHALRHVATNGYRPGQDAGRNPDWANYAIMNALVLNYCGAVFTNSTWSSVAATRMANIDAAIRRNNCDPEHNSPAYVGVAMTALALGAKLGQDADFRAKSAALNDILWGDLALHYNASMRNLSGPYYRAYGVDLTRANTETAMPLLAFTEDLTYGPSSSLGGNTATRFCILNGLTGLGTPANVPDAVEPAFLGFQGNRRFIDTYQNTQVTYNHDVAIEEDRMAAVINSYTAVPPYTAYWNPFVFPSYQLVMTVLHWKSGIVGGNNSIASLKIYDSSYYRSRFNPNGDIEVLLDRTGADYPLRFVATAASAVPAIIGADRWDIPGQSFDVITTLPAPSVSVSGAETTILYDTTLAPTNTVVLTLKFVKTATHDWLGGQFKTATLLEASSAGAANSAGLYLMQMPSGSAGHTAGLRTNDIVTAANGQAVKHPEDLFRAIRAANGGTVNLTVRRGGSNVAVPLGSAVPHATAIRYTSSPAYAWRNSRGGNWNAAINWRHGSVPLTTGHDTVSLADADLIFDCTLTLDTNVTVGGLVFGDVQPTDDWLVNGGGSFNLAPPTGTPDIEVVNQTTTLAVPLAGTAGFRKLGAGRLVLAATNTYTGDTTVTAGTLVIGTGGKLGTGNLNVADGAICELSKPAGTLATAASVYLASSGMLHLGSGVNEIVSRLYVNGQWQPAGIWNAARDAAHFSGGGNLIVLNGDPNAPADAQARTLYYSGSAGTLTWGDAGGTSLWSTNSGGSYNQPWTVGGDAVFEGTAATVGNAVGGVTVSNITVTAINYVLFADGSTNVMVLIGGAITTPVSASGTLNIGCPIAGSVGLTKFGAETLQIRGACTYSGSTTVKSGILLIGAGNDRLPTGTTLILGDGGTGSGVFQMNSRSQTVAGLTTAGTGTANRVINSSSTTSTFTVSNASDFVFGGNLGWTGNYDNNFNLVKGGSGTLTLSGANTYSNATTVTGGTLRVTGAINVGVSSTTGTATIKGGGSLFIDGGAVTLRGAGVGSTTITLGDASTAGYITVQNGGSLILTSGRVVMGAGNSSSANNSLPACAFTQTGGATSFDPGGTTYIGNYAPANMTISGGSLQAGALSLGTRAAATLSVGGSANVTFGTVTLGNAANPGNMQTVHLSGGTLTVGSVANSTGNSTFNFNGGTLKAAGASPAFLAADQAYVQAGGAIIDDGGFTNTIAQSLLHDPGLVGTDGGLIKQGNASLVLSGANTYNGGTVVSHGTLICSATGLLGTGNLTVAAGAMCSLQNVGGALADTASVHLSGVLDLTNGVNETVAKLFINGVEMPGGTWNAARAPLHFTGPGNLIVANSGVPFEPPQLTGGQWNTTQFEFQVSGPTGFTYTVQASSNLRDWAEVFSTNPAVMPFFWAESGLTGFPERFYRVSQAP